MAKTCAFIDHHDSLPSHNVWQRLSYSWDAFGRYILLTYGAQNWRQHMAKVTEEIVQSLHWFRHTTCTTSSRLASLRCAHATQTSWLQNIYCSTVHYMMLWGGTHGRNRRFWGTNSMATWRSWGGQPPSWGQQASPSSVQRRSSDPPRPSERNCVPCAFWMHVESFRPEWYIFTMI